MTRPWNILLLSSLSANLCLAGGLWYASRSHGPSAPPPPTTPGTRSGLGGQADAGNAAGGAPGADGSSTGGRAAKEEAAARIALPASDLARLLDYDFNRISCSGNFADCFDLSEASARELDQRLQRWLGEANELESKGLRLVEENGESYYKVEIPEQDRNRLYAEITSETSRMGLKNPDTIAAVILSHPRFAVLAESQEFGFNTDEAGNLYFDSKEITTTVSPSSSEMLERAKARYGHLYDFNHLK
ncbi:hypothetical protein [Luteolibacter sp. LG18]|uniref:hypothetical protein n=1 Tax=Luteolibacter sp. LG18 TaxID=2819286 RepID=UPI002B2E64AB|nr:hypothetical protein llg_40160 [Luteolibacter sp. LG18]